MPSFKLKVTKPDSLPSGADFAKAFQEGIQKSAALALRDLQSTVRTWKHQPAFDVTITQQGGDYSISAGTDDVIYGYVDAGTRAHEIRPKRSKYLRWKSGYKAKTRVGIIGSQEGGAFGEDVFGKAVHHPGFPGRQFMKTIAKRRQVTIVQETSQAVAQVLRKAK